ncbi:MAG: hypothetical protein Q9170_006085 [Blastenia crenularia]
MEYADSPTLLLPAQEHPFYPSSYTHSIQYYQPFKPVVESQSLPQASMNTIPSRKRSRDADDDFGPSYPSSSEGETTFPANIKACPAPPRQSLFSTGSSEKAADAHRKRQRQEPNQATFGTRLIDPMSVALNVSWRSIHGDPDREAWARACVKFIEHRHSLECLQGLAWSITGELLVASGDGIYLFSGDLQQGLRVASSWPECIAEFQANIGLRWRDRPLLRPMETRASSVGPSITSSSSEGSTLSLPPVPDAMDLMALDSPGSGGYLDPM